MSDERLDTLFRSPVTTHVLVFCEGESEIGYVTLYLEGERLAFYYYAFYALDHANRSLGLFMMTTAVGLFASRGCRHLYLGTCYAESALYKTQFAAVEFFNGCRWSQNLAELKFILQRQQRPAEEHLLEDTAYRAEAGLEDPARWADHSHFVSLAAPPP
jgi:hypothetical protein